MNGSLLGGLVVLALIDSTSFGTLRIPVWMLVQQRIRVAAVLTYLVTISAFYWALGILLLTGAGFLRDILADLGRNTLLTWVQLVVGAVLFGVSFLFGRKQAERRAQRRGGRPSRSDRWRHRVTGDQARLGTVATVAVLAGLVEAASMLPYLGAIGLLTTSGMGAGPQALTLTGYVLLMAVPALVLLATRVMAHRRIEPFLMRLDAWMQRNSQEVIGWILAIVGFMLYADAAQILRIWPYSNS